MAEIALEEGGVLRVCECEHLISSQANALTEGTQAGDRSMAYTDYIVQLSSFP